MASPFTRDEATDRHPEAGPSLLERAIARISPSWALRRHLHAQMLQRAYSAASPKDRWGHRRAGASANADHQADASTLRTKSRYLIQNVDYIAAGMNSRVAALVGTGIVPKFNGRDGKKLQALWDAWVPVADADGHLDLYGLQAAAARAMDADGEVLLRLRPRLPQDGLPVPLQLQLLEVDWLDNVRTTGDNGNLVIEGKEYDALGRWVACWLWEQHPGELTTLRGKTRVSKRVPAEQLIHLYAHQRPGQGRGFPRLSAVLNRARDQQLMDEYELSRRKYESAYSVLASGDVAGLANGITQDEAARTGSLGDVSPGIVQVPAGMNLTVLEPKPNPGFVDTCKYNISLVCAGGGFLYEAATGDMTQVNFSSARVRRIDFRREIEQVQWHTLVPVLCQRLCDEFARYAVLGGKLGGKAQASYTVAHTTPKWEYLNPKEDIESDLLEVAGGLSTISEKLRQRGLDRDKVFAELADDINELQRLKLWDSLLMLLKGKVSASQDAGAAKPQT